MDTMRSKEFPSAPLERIAREASGKRISEGATKSLRQLVLDRSETKAKEIVDVTKHAGRKTVLREDVAFSARRHPPI